MDIKKKKIAWGITGSGDRLNETLEVMKRIKREYEEVLEIKVYLSKAGARVLKYYKRFKDLEKVFGKLKVEIDSNTPFLAGALQLGKYEYFLIAPATSNTVAKISLGIADSLITNSAIMALKAFIPVYIMPSDYREGIVETELPRGKSLKLRVRKEDAFHTHKLTEIKDIYVVERPENLSEIFKKYFK